MNDKDERELKIEDFLIRNDIKKGKDNLEELVKSSDFRFNSTDILKMKDYAHWLIGEFKKRDDYNSVAELAEALSMNDEAISAYARLHNFGRALNLIDKWNLPKEKTIEVYSIAHNYHQDKIREYQLKIREMNSVSDKALNAEIIRKEYESAIQKHTEMAKDYSSLIKQLKR